MDSNQNATNDKPTILTFVSGKGGVGKTMLAVATAKELADVQPTLVIDLDFFNRGLSGLLSKGELVSEVAGFSLLEQGEEKESWKIIKVADNLFNVTYPDISQREFELLEQSSVDQLSIQLLDFIDSAVSLTKCSTVVLDCHGGPDSLSFAACMIAQYSVLVSEPDRITMYGTLHFLRKLHSVSESKEININLVFNKVVESFSPRFLRKVYNDNLREYFDDRPLLAIFPFEVYLTKEFEKYPFVTEHYPRSMLAKKMRVLLSDLLNKDHPEKLSTATKILARWEKTYIRNTFGNPPYILTLDFVLPIGFALILSRFLLDVATGFTRTPETLADQLQIITNFIDSSTFVWGFFAIIIILLAWNRIIDRQITYNAQRGRPFHLFFYSCILFFTWLFPFIFIFMNIIEDIGILREGMEFYLKNPDYLAILATMILSIFWAWSIQLFRAYREFRYLGHKTDPVARTIIFTILVLFSGLIGYYINYI
jgi:cellulose biosynthesis protein BcsQ